MTRASASRWVRHFERAGGKTVTEGGNLRFLVAGMDGRALERLMAMLGYPPMRRQRLSSVASVATAI